MSTEHHGAMDVLHFEREIARFDPSVVNLHYGVHHCSVKDVAAVLLARKRLVVTIHAPHEEDSGTLIARSRADIWAMRLAAPFVQAFVANSSATAKGIAATGVRQTKVHTVLCGVKPPEEFGRGRARRLLGIPESAFVISAVGGLVAYKGFVELAEAVGRLNETGCETLLLIAGDGPDAEAVADAARTLGSNCRMLGRVKDTAPVFAAADLFVLPSRQEGFGLVYLEAAFQGVPSIGCRSGGTPDAIGDASTGLLVQPGDTAELTEAIRSLRMDPERRLRMGAAAKARANTGYTDEVMADGYDKLLQRR
jgi:glycosyltransferase involved in cell wall biosynthesis